MCPRVLATSIGRRRMAGITLIELMIVVVVIGILGTIAIPSYRAYTIRSHRTDAKSALLAVTLAQERYYLTNRTYGTIAQLAATGYPTTSEHGMYTVTIDEDPDATTYTARATPTAGGGTNGVDMSSDTECSWFSINAAGLRQAAGAKCW